MNIFVIDRDPTIAAQQLPDKHVTKMILESTQMLSLVFSSHYWDLGPVMKVDGKPFNTLKGAFKNHPCTQWIAAQNCHCAWLIQHALALCDEFYLRYQKKHGLYNSLLQVKNLFEIKQQEAISNYFLVEKFARAMPDYLKNDNNISDIEAYRLYMNTKKWVYFNYIKLPKRRPEWLLPQDSKVRE